MNTRDTARQFFLTAMHLWRIRNPIFGYIPVGFVGVPESEQLVNAKASGDYYAIADVLPTSTSFVGVGRSRKRILNTCRLRLFVPEGISGKRAYDALESLEKQIDTAAITNSAMQRGLKFRAVHIDYRGLDGDYHEYALTVALEYDKTTTVFEAINDTVTDASIVPQDTILNEFATILDANSQNEIFGHSPIIFRDGQYQRGDSSA